MNKVILTGRLTKDPETRYSQNAEPLAITRYTLAVNRRSRKEGEPDADFINCVTFGKSAQFAEKYFRKGLLIAVAGRLQVRTWDNQEGQRHWITEVIVEEQDFGESRSSFEARRNAFSGDDGFREMPSNSPPSLEPTYGEAVATPKSSGSYSSNNFSAIEENIEDDDLPF